MSHNIYIYIFVMAGVTYLIRLLPLTFIRGEIKNTYIRSFLYYVPYVTLSVMTFPPSCRPPRASGPPLQALLSRLSQPGRGGQPHQGFCGCLPGGISSGTDSRYLTFMGCLQIRPNFLKAFLFRLHRHHQSPHRPAPLNPPKRSPWPPRLPLYRAFPYRLDHRQHRWCLSYPPQPI